MTTQETSRPARTASLIGRPEETARLRDLLAMRHGGGALVLTGDAGIGKSALLRDAVRAAEEQGHLVLEATGVDAEACLPFASLHQLLPAVLGTAFEPGGAPDVFPTALATLELLAELAARTPVLVVIEDAHWVD